MSASSKPSKSKDEGFLAARLKAQNDAFPDGPPGQKKKSGDSAKKQKKNKKKDKSAADDDEEEEGEDDAADKPQSASAKKKAKKAKKDKKNKKKRQTPEEKIRTDKIFQYYKALRQDLVTGNDIAKLNDDVRAVSRDGVMPGPFKKRLFRIVARVAEREMYLDPRTNAVQKYQIKPLAFKVAFENTQEFLFSECYRAMEITQHVGKTRITTNSQDFVLIDRLYNRLDRPSEPELKLMGEGAVVTRKNPYAVIKVGTLIVDPTQNKQKVFRRDGATEEDIRMIYELEQKLKEKRRLNGVALSNHRKANKKANSDA